MDRVYDAKDLTRQGEAFKCPYCVSFYRHKKNVMHHMASKHNITFITTARSQSAQYRERSKLTRLHKNATSSHNSSVRLVATNPPRGPATCSTSRSDLNSSVDMQESHNSDPLHSHSRFYGPLPESGSDSDNDSLMFCNLMNSPSIRKKLGNIGFKVLLLAYADHNKSTESSLKQLIMMLNLVLPESERLSLSFNDVKKALKMDGSELTKHFYCADCLHQRQQDGQDCGFQNCTSRKCFYFMTADITNQLELIFNFQMNWEMIVECKLHIPVDGLLCDITDGRMYRQFTGEGGFLHHSTNNISCTAFIDGSLVQKSSQKQVWPVYLVINELPYKLRMKRHNMILYSLYQTAGYPNFDHYMKVFAQFTFRAYRNGFRVKVNGVLRRICLLILTYVLDLLAKGHVFSMILFNGQMACILCYVEGKCIAKTMHFEYQDSLDMRTTRQIINDARAASQQSRVVNGFKDYPQILSCAKFSVSMVIVDYMHGILLGLVRRLIENWFFKENAGNISEHLDAIDREYLSLLPFNEVHRNPRSIYFYKHWKANECRNFLLYYSIHLLRNYLSPGRLTHLAGLVEATYLLLQNQITEEDISRAEYLLNDFVQLYPDLYAVPANRRHPAHEAQITLNIHNLLHLPDCVRNFSSLYQFSAFSFESLNGHLVRRLFSTQSVLQQAFFMHNAHKRAVELMEKSEGDVRNFLSYLLNGRTYTVAAEVGNIKVLGETSPASNDDLQMALHMNPNVTLESLHVFSKLVKNGTYMDSILAKRRIKTKQSCFVRLNANIHNASFMCVSHYLFDSDDNEVYAVGHKITLTGEAVKGLAPNVQNFEIDDGLYIFDSLSLDHSVFACESNGSYLLALPPNKSESD